MSQPPFPIPERVSSLMSPSRRQILRDRQARSVSTASRISEISQTSCDSTVSDFLAAKIRQCEEDHSFFFDVEQGLQDARLQGTLSDQDFVKELVPYLSRFRTTSSTLRILKRQKALISDDIDEAAGMNKRLRDEAPADGGLLERAYRDSIVSRIMRAEGKQAALKFDQSEFKANVIDYYSATQPHIDDLVWCHVLGDWCFPKDVKAAHIVPKSLDREELAHLFGSDDVVVSLPSNALCLYHKVESLLDKGDIAIVPSAEISSTAWKCIVLNEKRNKDIIRQRRVDKEGKQVSILRVQDLHNRPLVFLTENRPRRRYLYLRFLISYLWCKRNDVPNLKARVESKRFWPSAGDYLHRSTLQTLARCISGCEIPKDLTAKHTFEKSNDAEQDLAVGMGLAADLIRSRDGESEQVEGPDLLNAVTESIKRL